ncbi:hypothetical protein OnM2_064043 [Erysiphe neolycopersici]|uniref:Uncharacterized protein n=1 Tax=Erysiphe neolycopersici TaxID=212602 RepID=A0A420HN76_9PEZI|nr:hypothetical protein OnM2_064043 [Erysiphe neolycopersici]
MNEILTEELPDSKVGKDESRLFDKDGNLKAALLLLIPEDIFYIVEDKNMSREMWESIQEYFRPYGQFTINSLRENFWKFSMEKGTDVDIFAEELIKKQVKIASEDISMRPSDSIMKNRLLDHFDSYPSGHYSGAVTVLRNDASVSFNVVVNSLRSNQMNYKRAHPEPVIAFV